MAAKKPVDWRKELEKLKRQEWVDITLPIQGTQVAVAARKTLFGYYHTSYVDPVTGKRETGRAPMTEVHRALEQRVKST